MEWIYGKVLPGAYAHEHITHYTRAGLTRRLVTAGYPSQKIQSVGFCEMIFQARKPIAEDAMGRRAKPRMANEPRGW